MLVAIEVVLIYTEELFHPVFSACSNALVSKGARVSVSH